MASLERKKLRERDGQIDPVNPFPPRDSPLTSKIAWYINFGILYMYIYIYTVLDRVRYQKPVFLAGLGGKGLINTTSGLNL